MRTLALIALIVVVSISVGQPLVVRKTLHAHQVKEGTVIVYATKLDLLRFKVEHPRLKTEFTSVANLVAVVADFKHYSSNYGPKWALGDVVEISAEVQFISGRKRWIRLGKQKITTPFGK